jgi:hypothetical protein
VVGMEHLHHLPTPLSPLVALQHCLTMEDQ